MIRVLIADDHAVVRQGLRTYLELQDDVEVVAEAADGEAAVREAARARARRRAARPRDAAARRRRARCRGCASRCPTRACSCSPASARTTGCSRRCAAAPPGFLLKDTEPAELVRAIRTAHAGQATLSPAVATRVVEQLAGGGRPRALDLLTPRELEVLRLIARGHANKRIALELGVAEKTVKTHVGHVLAKLDLTDRTQAALYAVREGLAPG